jgi:predicted lipid carrier protein YhbT
VATAEQCEAALHALADRLAADGSPRRKFDSDRTLSCTIRDLQVIFTGRLASGQLIDIARGTSRDAQIRITVSSDDLVALVAGQLRTASAFATRRLRVDAAVRDLVRLRSLF